jgi:NTP pyrophosphatase (non-canonical NTP hydrolase)
MASKEQLYKAAWVRWGKESQMQMLAEECCELAQAALKQNREHNGRDIDNLCEEMADVELMCESFRYNYLDISAKIDRWKDIKLRRLESVLQEATNEES